MNDATEKTPRWTNRLLMVAALLACIASLAVLLVGWQRGRHHHHGLIADLTRGGRSGNTAPPASRGVARLATRRE